MTAPRGFAELLDHSRALVCVGTGGVGKTTIAAALGLAAALRGRRAMVLTIDPARQLARALGLASLRAEGERVSLGDLSPAPGRTLGTLSAAMLHQKAAWDAFVARHVASPSLRQALLDNPFYQQLSQSLAGSTEYMALEELCFLQERGDHDLLVIDTPPATHAVDFLHAPARIQRLLDPSVARWLSQPYAQLGRGAFRAMSSSVRLVVATLERAAGSRTLGQIASFFTALEGVLDEVAERAAQARGLLASEHTSFVLVAAPSEGLLEDGQGLLGLLTHLGIELRAAVLNRTHPLPRGPVAEAEVDNALQRAELDGADPAAIAWLREAWRQAVVVDRGEQAHVASLAAYLSAATAWAEIPELSRDAHSLRDLRAIAAALGGIG